MKTVYQIARRLRGERGQNQDLTVISKGYEDRLPDNKMTEPRLRGERGQNQDLTVISKGYEDRLPDNKKTTWRERTEPRPHCNIERI